MNYRVVDMDAACMTSTFALYLGIDCNGNMSAHKIIQDARVNIRGT